MDGMNPRGGWIEVITGGMFSGKSEELIRRIRRAEIARQRAQIFKPAIDNRFDVKRIISRDNRGLDAIAVGNSAELRANLVFGVKVVGIDEVQFFDEPIVDLSMELADAGVRVIAAGLDQDYMRRPFGPMPQLLAVAEYVSKMHAVCVRCGGLAHYTQRVAGGNSQIEIGDETYEARCRMCYEPYIAETRPEKEDDFQPQDNVTAIR
ncbi:MAG TPA: thymidine kinase [Blastocatellia bacterium]|nr:thymidine kinase [Blastocatellia bacterium]